MRRRRFALLLALASLALALPLSGCPQPSYPRPYPAPTAKELLDHLRSLPARAPSLKAETRSDVRLGNSRANVTVHIYAAWGGKLRFQAADPNDTTAADLASDGRTYCLLDVHANCSECGPATPENVASLVRIPLEPDEVVAVLLGSAPILDGPAEVVWDAGAGHEIVTIHGGGRTERLVLDGHDKRWDLLEAVESGEGGKTLWSVRHKDFHDVAGGQVRLPGASLFEQAGESVRILWNDQVVGPPPDDKVFHLELPPGLPACRRS